MATVYFDTLKFATKMEAAGFTREQSKGAVEAYNEAIADTLVTQSMLKETQLSLETRMESIKVENYKFHLGQTAILAGLMIALLKFFN